MRKSIFQNNGIAICVFVLLFAMNDGWMYRDSTTTFPFENTFANPAPKFPLLCVLTVVDPDGGIRNGMFGCVTASGIRLPLL